MKNLNEVKKPEWQKLLKRLETTEGCYLFQAEPDMRQAYGQFYIMNEKWSAPELVLEKTFTALAKHLSPNVHLNIQHKNLLEIYAR